MPARRLHKTKPEQELAARNKHRAYYDWNRETILSKKRKKYCDHRTQESQARKDKNEEKKRALWEARAAEDIQPQKSIERLRELERAINAEINPSATQPYFERLYYEFLAWSSCDPRPSKSPIELPFKLFGSMLSSVANIGNAILNEYGAVGKEWKETQRLTRRIRYLNQCIDDMEVADLEGKGLLESRHAQGKLLYQEEGVQHWINRLHARILIPSLDVLASAE